MQLWEQGLVDLDGPASDYLRSHRLIPADARFRLVTVRHLPTHTAGIGYWRQFSDLLRSGGGSGVRDGRSVPSLADYYRRGLPVEVEPGTKWVYSNHGFAMLGQIVEDVSGQPLDRYLRDHVCEPSGMERTDRIRSEWVRPHLATGVRAALPRTQGRRRPRGAGPGRDRCVRHHGGHGSLRRRPFCMAAPTSTVRCSCPRPLRPCSNRTSSSVPGAEDWVGVPPRRRGWPSHRRS